MLWGHGYPPTSIRHWYTDLAFTGFDMDAQNRAIVASTSIISKHLHLAQNSVIASFFVAEARIIHGEINRENSPFVHVVNHHLIQAEKKPFIPMSQFFLPILNRNTIQHQ